MCFFFNDTATTEIYTLSLHDALPIFDVLARAETIALLRARIPARGEELADELAAELGDLPLAAAQARSEEHTSELQSRQYLVCRLLLEKKKDFDSTSSYIAGL